MKKQKIKPSAVMLILIGVFLVIAAIVVGLDIYTGGTPTSDETFATGFAVIAFVFYLVKFIFAKRVEFDFDGFTVRGKTYRFSDISEAEITHKRVLRPSRHIRFSTVTRIRLYIRENCVLSLTEDELGYEEFVAVLKKHRVKFHVRNSLSSWKGVIE